MKLYILRPIDDESGPWKPWYDKAFGFVVCAKDEKTARQIASAHAGDEERYEDSENYLGPSKYHAPSVWQNPAYTSCVVLKASEYQGLIMKDFRSA